MSTPSERRSASEAERSWPKDYSWYGWQTLTVDAVALGTIALGAVCDAEALAWAGVIGYAAGPPVVHAAHERYGIAGASVGVRVGAPAVGFAIGSAFDGCNDEDLLCLPTAEESAGMLAGFASAIVIDAAFLAWEPKPSSTSREQSRSGRIRPSVAVRDSGMSLSVGGTW